MKLPCGFRTAVSTEGLGKSVKILKHFEKGKINMLYKINKAKNKCLKHHRLLKKY
jgi:hypothetical protein